MLLLGLVVAAAGCAGDGSALVDGMLDVPGGTDRTCPPANPPAAPTLAELQRQIFGGVCGKFCHFEGGIGPFRLDTAEQTFQNLVGVTSLCTLPRARDCCA
jgi:hypothetical protein